MYFCGIIRVTISRRPPQHFQVRFTEQLVLIDNRILVRVRRVRTAVGQHVSIMMPVLLLCVNEYTYNTAALPSTAVLVISSITCSMTFNTTPAGSTTGTAAVHTAVVLTAPAACHKRRCPLFRP